MFCKDRREFCTGVGKVTCHQVRHEILLFQTANDFLRLCLHRSRRIGTAGQYFQHREAVYLDAKLLPDQLFPRRHGRENGRRRAGQLILNRRRDQVEQKRELARAMCHNYSVTFLDPLFGKIFHSPCRLIAAHVIRLRIKLCDQKDIHSPLLTSLQIAEPRTADPPAAAGHTVPRTFSRFRPSRAASQDPSCTAPPPCWRRLPLTGPR